jgi:tetratricopeptide (TPR) repeat protein
MRKFIVCYLILISCLVPSAVRSADLPTQWQDYAQPPKRGFQKQQSQATELALTNRLETLIADEKTSPDIIESYLEKLVAICAYQGKFDTADDYSKHALRFVEKQHGDELMQARLHATIGDLYFREHKFTQAELEYAKALKLLPAQESNENLRAKFNLGLAQVLAEEHRFNEAAKLFQENYSQANPDPGLLVAFGKCLAESGRLDEAAKKLSAAIAIDRAWRGKDDATVAIEINDLALIRVQQGQLEEARKLMQAVSSIPTTAQTKSSVQ